MNNIKLASFALAFTVLGLVVGYVISDVSSTPTASASFQCTVDRPILTRLYSAILHRPLDSEADFHLGKTINTVLSDFERSPESRMYGGVFKALKAYEEGIRSDVGFTTTDMEAYLDLIDAAISNVSSWSYDLPEHSPETSIVSARDAREAIQSAYDGLGYQARQRAHAGLLKTDRPQRMPSQLGLPRDLTKPSANEYDGLGVLDMRVGTGDVALTDLTLSVHYTGKLQDGTVFDDSYNRGTPFEFTLGEGLVIEGWEKGLIGMKVGGKRRITVPPALAYGDREIGNIPASSTLIFEVELLEIK